MGTCAKLLFVDFCKDRKTGGWCLAQKQQNILDNLKENLTSLITSLHLLLHLILNENNKPKIPDFVLFVLVSVISEVISEVKLYFFNFFIKYQFCSKLVRGAHSNIEKKCNTHYASYLFCMLAD